MPDRRIGVALLVLAACGDGGGLPLDAGAAPEAAADAPEPAQDAASDGAVTSLLELTATIAEATSGTRLQALNWEPVDGTPRFRRWYDRQTKEACTFILAADGVRRCLPASSVAFPGERGAFSDERCELPVLRRTATSCPAGAPGYLRPGVWLGGCRHGARLHRPQPISAGYTFAPERGTCVPLTLAPGETLYQLGEELPITDFVAAQDVPGEAAGGLAPVIRQGEDGSRSFVAWRDSHGQACSLEPTSAGPRCLPSLPGGSFEPYVHPAPDCKGRALRFSKASCPELDEPVHAAEIVGQGCGYLAIPHRILESIPVTYEPGTDGVCQMREASIRELAFASEPTDPGPFPAMQLGFGAGTGRVRPLLYQTAAGVAATPGSFDTRLKVPCFPGVAEDGVMRCIPSLPTHGLYFADATCSETPLWRFPEAACRSDLVAVISRGRCPTSTSVYQLDPAPYDGLVYASLSVGEACAALPSNSPLRMAAFFKAGPRLPPTDLVELRESQP